MAKLVDTKRPTYYAPPETWLVEPESDSTSAIQAELDDIPSTAPAGSLAEVLISTGLKVYMKKSSGSWIEI